MILCSAVLWLVAAAPPSAALSAGVGAGPPPAVRELASPQLIRWFRKLMARRTNMKTGAVPATTSASHTLHSNGASGTQARGSQQVDPTLYVGVRVTPTVMQRIKAKLTRRTTEAAPPGPDLAPSSSSGSASARRESPVAGDRQDLSSFRSTSSRRSSRVSESLSAPSDDASAVGRRDGVGVRSRRASGEYEPMSAPLDGDWSPASAVAPATTTGINQRGLQDGPAIKYPNGKGAVFAPLPATPPAGQLPVKVKYPNGKGAIFAPLPPTPAAEPGGVNVKYPKGKGAVFGALPPTPIEGQPAVNEKYPNGKGEIFASTSALLGSRSSSKFVNADGVVYSRLPDVIDPSTNAGLSVPGLRK